MEATLIHTGKRWELELRTDIGALAIPVTDSEAELLQDIGVEVWSA